MDAYLSALLITAASLLLGAALSSHGGRSGTGASVGLAVLMLLSFLSIRLPGHGATAAVVIGLALVAAAVVVVVRCEWPGIGVPLAVTVAVIAVCSLPFIANDRVGILGASFNDDLSFHMRQADAMRAQGAHADITGEDYPTGPHSFVATLAEGTPFDIASIFTGLLLATPAVLALTALGALEARRWPVRTLGATLVGTSYLLVSYVAQGAFKEPLLALFVLGFVLTLRGTHPGERLDLSRIAALTLTVGAGMTVFGIVALAWFGAIAGSLGLLQLARRRQLDFTQWHPSRQRAAAATTLAAVGVAGLAFGTREFFSSGPGRYLTDSGVGGNYVGQLSPLEALGGWPAPDFRYSPTMDTLFVVSTVIAVWFVVHGLVWCCQRREWVLLAGATGTAAVYVVARPVTLAYFSGKALVVAAPLLVLIGVKAALELAENPRASALVRRIAAAGFTLFAGIALISSALALRAAQVGPKERGPDLERFARLVADHRTLYLGRDNYAGWYLRTARLWGYQRYPTRSARRLEPRARKRAGDADPPAVDVDSIDYRALNDFRYLVTPSTRYASVPPANFTPIRRTPWHILWKRRGRTPQRSILDEGEAPGAVFDCSDQRTRAMRNGGGRALVRPRPFLGRVAAWRDPRGATPAVPGRAFSGQALVQRLHLARGTWELSIRYFSPVSLRVTAGRLQRRMPAYLADRSTFARAGRVTTNGGVLTVEVTVPQRHKLGPEATALLGSMAAVRVDRRPRLVPLRAACGRYVDWIDPGVVR
jgi:hypothetical protein